jgi:hypothetical protein
MIKRFVLASSALALGLAAAVPASAATIFGSFSLASFSGSYVNGTAATATGLDFGPTFGGSGNGYGTNGSALVGNASGSFAGLNGTTASVADISLGTFANPFTTNPFISFGGNSPITLSFTDASYTRTGTSLTITGGALFSNGNPAEANTGTFTLATSSQDGMASAVDFTFTSNASTSAVPEPASWAMMLAGFGMLGAAMRRRKPTTAVSFG